MKAAPIQLTALVVFPMLAACASDSAPPFAPSASALLTFDHSRRFSDWSTPVSLGPVVNSVFTDADPFVSKDGLSLYFAGGAGLGGSGGRDIWVSRRASPDDPWEAPRNVGIVVNGVTHEDRPSLSVDGHLLYFASDRPGGFGDFDLYVSRRRDKRDDFGWESPVNLGSAFNTAFSEQSSVTGFEDDVSGTSTLYFASNRAGGLGDFDIYAVRQLSDDDFGAAELVRDLSSVHRDRDPSIRRDGLEMFLGSNRPGTYGGMDLWTASRASTGDPWFGPVNLGAEINSPTRSAGLEQSNDQRPTISFDGRSLYFAAAFRPGNVGFMFDIWVTTRDKIKGQ